MDRVTVANLQAELACLDSPLSDVAPRHDHGPFPDIFEAPAGSTTSLNPPSKTKSMFTFGIDGTLAWTTPAGELLQVASCLDNKLIAVEYKRSIDRGQGYFDRGKMLERALDQPQGSGFGIGLSLDPALEPLDKSWLYNRWPRYHFMHEGLDIRLQYYIDHHSIIQQYSVRNNGEEEKLLSYTFSSDLVFREHRGSASRIHLVPRDKTPERLFLFGNSEVLIQNQAEKCQVVMALFQNGQRQSLWSGKSQGSHDDGDASSLISSDSAADYDENEIQEVEARMRRTILHGQLADDSADAEFKSFYSRYNEDNDSPKQPRLQDHLDYSSSDIKLIVPGRSTQELRAVIQINKLPQSGVDVLTQDRKSIDNIGDLKTAAKDPRSDIRRIRARQRNVVAKAQLFSAKPPALKKWPTWKLIDDHLELGKACALAKLLGEARYHMLTACLIAEYTCGAASIKATDTQFQYAKFLNKYGWSSVGLKKMEQLSHDLSTRVSKNGQISMLKEKIRLRLAALYLEQGNFPGAEDMYIKAFGDQVGHPGNIDLTPSAAHCLERAAWAQIRQENYTAARSNYLLLLDLIPSQREVILINLGFVEMRLDNTEQARWRYETALLPDTGMREYYAKELHAQSGLFACLLKTGVDVEGNLEVAASRVRYVDVFTPLFRSTQSKLPIDEGAFHFAMTRQLETLLTACSIPVTNDNGDAGVAFVDADPLGCLFEGRAAYFQFRFLTQCREHFRQTHNDEHAQREATARIKSACQNHLTWVFKIAKFSDTWENFYTVGGDALDMEKTPNVPTLSRAVEGALHYSKLWLYIRTWPDEWSFVLEMLHTRLREWLAYLQSTQHMGNLWVERQVAEILKPHDTISAGNGSVYRYCPRYELSDFMFLWLALKEIEITIESIPNLWETEPNDSARRKLAEVQRAFDEHGKSLNAHNIRSNILRTFIVSKQGEIASRYITTENVTASPDESMFSEPRMNARVNSSDSTRSMDRVGPHLQSVRYHRNRETNSRVIASQRTIHDYSWEIQATDIAIIEAAAVGFFEDPNKEISVIWQETLDMHKDLYVVDFEEPQRIALTMFSCEENFMLTRSPRHEIRKLSQERLLTSLYDSGAFAQKLVDDAPETMRSWSGITYETLSMLVGSLYAECRPAFPSHDGQQGTYQPPRSPAKSQLMSGPGLRRRKSIVMPQQVGSSLESGRETVIDSVFLPDWMYHYPEYIHEKPLQINVEADLEQVESLPGLTTAVDKWRDQKIFSLLRWDKQPFFPTHIADAGAKESVASRAHGKSAKRQIAINYQWSAKRTFERLVKPRNFDQAKKRLIEFASHDQENTLICWLTAPEQERPLLLEFIRRHGSSTCLFGERVDWKGNIWETEIHLGFYQLVDENGNKRFPPHFDYPSRLRRVRKMPNLSNTPDPREITLVSTSLRFVGDLRDRSWTCHFLSSIARDDGFTSLADESTERGQRKEEFYSETMGQRKLLELTYVQKILFEMGESSNGILEAFQSELDVPDTRDPQRESYEFVHNYSRLHLKAGEILRDILTQLDLALQAIEQWERREDTRPVRSRWSRKDEDRYGQNLIALSRRCRTSIQNLRMQKNRLEEQQKSAEQRHNNLVSYMQLSEARTSSRSAEDVRLFTYVTIIFLPLSFSSSLFSMQAAPTGGILHVMVPTTIIALILTFFGLSNLKALDRNFNFWLYKASANARAKMKSSKHLWGFAWPKISKELEESTQLRLAKPEDEEHLPAQSTWWYLLFGFSYALRLPRLFVLQGVRAWESRRGNNPLQLVIDLILLIAFLPVCILIFAAQFSIITAVDMLGLIWKSARALSIRAPESPSNGQEPSELSEGLTDEYLQEKKHERQHNQADGSNDESPSIDLAVTTKHFKTTVRTIFDWLQSPPRPMKYYSWIKPNAPEPAKEAETEAQLEEPDPKDSIASISDEALSEDDEWEKAIERDAPKTVDRGGASQRRSEVFIPETHQGRLSWWKRWKSSADKQDKTELNV